MVILDEEHVGYGAAMMLRVGLWQWLWTERGEQTFALSWFLFSRHESAFLSFPWLHIVSLGSLRLFSLKQIMSFLFSWFFFAFCSLFYSSRPRLKLDWRSKTIAKFPDTKNCLHRHPCASASSTLPYTETVSFSTWQRLNGLILLH